MSASNVSMFNHVKPNIEREKFLPVMILSCIFTLNHDSNKLNDDKLKPTDIKA